MTNRYQLYVKTHGTGIALILLGLVEILDFLGSKKFVTKLVGFVLEMVGMIKFVIEKQSCHIKIRIYESTKILNNFFFLKM